MEAAKPAGKRSRTKYDAAFRAEAIRRVNQDGQAATTLKTELLPRRACFADLEEARLELAEYLDHYYNTQHLHSALGYCTPLEIELHYLSNLP